MTQKDMQKFISILFFILFPIQLLAADYDAFILNFLRVTPMENELRVDMALGAPTTIALEKTLKEGQILRVSIEIELIRERLLRNKNIKNFTKEYFLQYEPLARQFMVSELQDKDNDWCVLLRNSDPQYLLETLLNNLHYTIAVDLEHNKNYIMYIHTNIKQVVGKNWAQKNIFFLENTIIQPARFEYNFDF